MILKILGTGGGEGIPGMWCNCPVCKRAREIGGKDLRSRTQSLIDDDLLIDYPQDSFYHMQKYGLDYNKIKTVIITHSHADHWCGEICARDPAARHWTDPAGNLSVYGSAETIKGRDTEELAPRKDEFVEYHTIKPWDIVEKDGYKITALPACHNLPEKALLYLIQKDGKSIMYCTDTGFIYADIIDYLRDNQIHLDIVTFDCTFGLIPRDLNSHMNFYDAVKNKAMLQEADLIDDKTKVVCQHICHRVTQTHSEFQEIADKYGIIIAYDGIELQA